MRAAPRGPLRPPAATPRTVPPCCRSRPTPARARVPAPRWHQRRGRAGPRGQCGLATGARGKHLGRRACVHLLQYLGAPLRVSHIGDRPLVVGLDLVEHAQCSHRPPHADAKVWSGILDRRLRQASGHHTQLSALLPAAEQQTWHQCMQLLLCPSVAASLGGDEPVGECCRRCRLARVQQVQRRDPRECRRPQKVLQEAKKATASRLPLGPARAPQVPVAPATSVHLGTRSAIPRVHVHPAVQGAL